MFKDIFKKSHIASAVIIIVFIVAHSLIMFLDAGNNDVYLFGNAACWLLLCIGILYASDNKSIPVAALLTGVCASNFVEDYTVLLYKLKLTTSFWMPFELGINDYVGLGVAIIISLIVWYRYQKPDIVNINNAFLLSTVLLLYYSRNVDFVELSMSKDPDLIYFKGDALSYFLVSLFLMRSLTGKPRIVAIYFVIVAFGNAMDDLFFDPSKITVHELYFAVGGLLYCGYLWRKQSRAIT